MLLGLFVAPILFGGRNLAIGNEESEEKAFVEHLACLTSSGCGDPLVIPVVDPNLASLGNGSGDNVRDEQLLQEQRPFTFLLMLPTEVDVTSNGRVVSGDIMWDSNANAHGTQ
ncbi:hypothetical protein OIU74_013329, partial [Salix koriyanagi]